MLRKRKSQLFLSYMTISIPVIIFAPFVVNPLHLWAITYLTSIHPLISRYLCCNFFLLGGDEFVLVFILFLFSQWTRKTNHGKKLKKYFRFQILIFPCLSEVSYALRLFSCQVKTCYDFSKEVID